jgi:hypothetical protein
MNQCAFLTVAASAVRYSAAVTVLVCFGLAAVKAHEPKEPLATGSNDETVKLCDVSGVLGGKRDQ